MRVDSGSTGSNAYAGVYKSKRVIVRREFDHAGSYSETYLQWNGNAFVAEATIYELSSVARRYYQNAKSYYWVQGKGEVSSSVAKQYVRNLVGGTSRTAIGYQKYSF
ncbi:MAG: hypothetical protein IKF78_09750 [Atopobiaceae bacterium]|nr:hypothetical protein [Atopobiaceae bacterium]